MVLRPVIRKLTFKKKAYFERRLPKEGEISCKIGESVKPFDVIGSTFVSLSKRSIRISASEWSIKVTDVTALNSGDVVAKKRGLLFNREVIRMPFSGTVYVDEDDGVVKIEILSFPEKYNLISGINAKVEKVIEKNSVLLETPAYIINGVYGNGHEVIGEIKTIGNFDTPLLLSNLTNDLIGKIVVCGSYISPEVVNKAQALGITAIIVGGANLSSIKGNTPVIVTEGFGRIPMNRKVWDFCVKQQLKTAIIEPQRHQVIIPTDGNSSDEYEDQALNDEYFRELKVDHEVQVFVWPYFGYSGKVIRLGRGKSTFPSGIEDLPVKIKLINGEIVEVPVSNIGILG